MKIPRPEYPRPQFVRDQWLCLNGKWEFEIDHGDSGIDRGLCKRPLNGTITVPFCPESELSGIGHVDFMAAVWYRRVVKLPSNWAGKRVLLHFGAVDYDATIWVNDVEVARHRGGFTPITCDLAGIASGGDSVTIVVRARDDHRQLKPEGKQSAVYPNLDCHYTRSTGIWQTVWLEPVNAAVSLMRPRFTPDVANLTLRLQQQLSGNAQGYTLRAILKDINGPIGTFTVPADSDFSPQLDLKIPKSRARLWSIEDPYLYDIDIALLDAKGKVVDQITSYAGLRSVTIQGKAVLLNGKVVFQRLVLDQGIYPDGIYTAPTDKALRKDIELSIEAGFNGARLHQKVFEERFLYHADQMGYLVWGEFPDWGCNRGPEGDNQRPTATYITQWTEAIERDYSHPSIVGWCPLNETWQKLTDDITQLDDVTYGMYQATKVADGTRPVLDASGYSHRVPHTDIYDSHDYEQKPEKFAENQKGLGDGKPYLNRGPNNSVISVPYRGQPYFVSEFGGIWWNPAAKPTDFSWGYGDRPKSIEEFYARFEGLFNVLLDDPDMFGYCYTQLTDVYQEQNGIYTFDRKKKFNMKKIRDVQMRPAAIEKKIALSSHD
jgi:beta-galactosidase/beta-glucuronidase